MKKQACLQKTIYSLLLLTSVSAFSEQISTHIVGGSDATNSSQYPWIVSLKNNSGQHFSVCST